MEGLFCKLVTILDIKWIVSAIFKNGSYTHLHKYNNISYILYAQQIKTKLQFSFCGNAVCRVCLHVSYTYKKQQRYHLVKTTIKLEKRQETFPQWTIGKVQPLSYKRQVLNTLSHLTAVFPSDTVDLKELSYNSLSLTLTYNNQIIRKKGENFLKRKQRM